MSAMSAAIGSSSSSNDVLPSPVDVLVAQPRTELMPRRPRGRLVHLALSSDTAGTAVDPASDPQGGSSNVHRHTLADDRLRSYRSPTVLGLGKWMPLFMIERRFADELDVTLDVAAGINRVNEDEGVRWLYSFLSANKKKTYCLYEAPSADAIRRAAVRAGIPADEITEVAGRMMPDATLDEAPVW